MIVAYSSFCRHLWDYLEEWSNNESYHIFRLDTESLTAVWKKGIHEEESLHMQVLCSDALFENIQIPHPSPEEQKLSNKYPVNSCSL